MATCESSPGDKPPSLLDLIHIVSRILILQNQRTGRTTGNRTESKEFLQHLVYTVCRCQFGCWCFASIGVYPAKNKSFIIGLDWNYLFDSYFAELNYQTGRKKEAGDK